MAVQGPLLQCRQHGDILQRLFTGQFEFQSFEIYLIINFLSNFLLRFDPLDYNFNSNAFGFSKFKFQLKEVIGHLKSKKNISKFFEDLVMITLFTEVTHIYNQIKS